jgi:hypothetical protein
MAQSERQLTNNEAFDEMEHLLLRAANKGHDPDEFMDRARALFNASLIDPKYRPLSSTDEFITRLCPHCQLAVLRSVAAELGLNG